MNSIKIDTHIVKIGDLLRDLGDGEVGLVVGIAAEWSHFPDQPAPAGVLVKWPSIKEPLELDTSAISGGWVEIVSEA